MTPTTRTQTQDRVFWDGEGDRWHQRNSKALQAKDLEQDPSLKLLAKRGLKPKRALEIGASDGYRLAELNRRYRTRCWAIEPSSRAVRLGRARHPGVHFLRGVAHDLPAAVRGRRFDLVIVNFVLHWVDRGHLLRTAAEIDAVLEDGGHLILGDFLPPAPEKVAYHHLPGRDVWTYKQDYSRLFTSTCLYHPIATQMGRLGRPCGGNSRISSRTSTFLLRKEQLYAAKRISL